MSERRNEKNENTKPRGVAKKQSWKKCVENSQQKKKKNADNDQCPSKKKTTLVDSTKRSQRGDFKDRARTKLFYEGKSSRSFEERASNNFEEIPNGTFDEVKNKNCKGFRTPERKNKNFEDTKIKNFRGKYNKFSEAKQSKISEKKQTKSSEPKQNKTPIQFFEGNNTTALIETPSEEKTKKTPKLKKKKLSKDNLSVSSGDSFQEKPKKNARDIMEKINSEENFNEIEEKTSKEQVVEKINNLRKAVTEVKAVGFKKRKSKVKKTPAIIPRGNEIPEILVKPKGVREILQDNKKIISTSLRYSKYLSELEKEEEIVAVTDFDKTCSFVKSNEDEWRKKICEDEDDENKTNKKKYKNKAVLETALIIEDDNFYNVNLNNDKSLEDGIGMVPISEVKKNKIHDINVYEKNDDYTNGLKRKISKIEESYDKEKNIGQDEGEERMKQKFIEEMDKKFLNEVYLELMKKKTKLEKIEIENEIRRRDRELRDESKPIVDLDENKTKILEEEISKFAKSIENNKTTYMEDSDAESGFSSAGRYEAEEKVSPKRNKFEKFEERREEILEMLFQDPAEDDQLKCNKEQSFTSIIRGFNMAKNQMINLITEIKNRSMVFKKTSKNVSEEKLAREKSSDVQEIYKAEEYDSCLSMLEKLLAAKQDMVPMVAELKRVASNLDGSFETMNEKRRLCGVSRECFEKATKATKILQQVSDELVKSKSYGFKLPLTDVIVNTLCYADCKSDGALRDEDRVYIGEQRNFFYVKNCKSLKKNSSFNLKRYRRTFKRSKDIKVLIGYWTKC